MNSDSQDERVRDLLRIIRSVDADQVPQGGLRRIFRTARAAASTGVSMLSGRFRGRGDGGLSRADIETIERLVRNLGELKGLTMKAGQIFSYIDDSLPPEMRSLMALLQTQSQPTSFDRLKDVIRDDLGERASELIAGLEPSPLSVASIGQVHRGVLPDGTAVAVKVLHPGIREALESDFRMASIGPAFARLIVPAGAASVEGFVAEARERMMEECDYVLEARRQREFARLHRGNAEVVIPSVHPAWSGARVLTTTWEGGDGLERFLAGGPPQALRDMVGEALFKFYFSTLYKNRIFHADPHPGNYAFRPDGQVVVYDFGCVREFDAETVSALRSLAHAVTSDDAQGVVRAFASLGGEVPPGEKAYLHVRKLLRGFFAPLLESGPHPIDASVSLTMGEVMRDKMMLMRLRMPGKLLFLFRIRFGLYAVLSRLGACADWAAIERAALSE